MLAFAARGDPVSLAMSIMPAVFSIVQAVIGLGTNRWIVNTVRLQAQRKRPLSHHR
jgi:hypothetical protein